MLHDGPAPIVALESVPHGVEDPIVAGGGSEVV